MFIPHIEIRRCNERMKQVFGLLLREKNILCFFLIDLILFACALFARSLFDTTYGTGFLILTILLCFLSFYFLIRSFMSLSERIQENLESTLLAQQIEFQNEHLLSALQANKDMASLRLKLQEAAQGLQAADEQESREIANHLLQEYGNDLLVSYCQNRIIDAILYNKVLILRKMHIRYTILASVVQEIPIDSFSVMAVLTNMIDNAIEACQRVDFRKRKIQIDIYQKANYIVFQIENSITDDVRELKPGHSTKKDATAHGMGLHILQRVCEQHEGSYRYEIDQQTKRIRCTAILRCREQQDAV